MVKMKHPTMRFNFTPPGEVFETTDDCVEYLVKTYGCEVVSEDEPPLKLEFDPIVKAIDDAYEFTDTEDEVDEVKADDIEYIEDAAPAAQYVKVINLPIKRKAGWYEWEGKKYRKNNLPAEAAALLE